MSAESKDNVGRGEPPQAVELKLDLTVYRLSAIKKAAYKFADRFYIELSVLNDQQAQVRLTPKVLLPYLQAVSGEFCNEVLDQELRELVAQETEGIRNILLAQAFSATSLVDAVGDDGDYRDDALAIRKSRDRYPPAKGVPP